MEETTRPKINLKEIAKEKDENLGKQGFNNKFMQSKIKLMSMSLHT